MSGRVNGLDEFLFMLHHINNRAAHKREFNNWLEALGFQFLEEIQREIIRTGTVQTRNLLNGFQKGNAENVWTLDQGNLKLEIGTNVEYAVYANEGHNQEKRFVPGEWVGSGANARFEYRRGARSGMMLKAKWVEGSHYFDTAERVFERMFQRSIDRKFAEWLRRIGR